jgi:hypothetical protein
MEPMISEERKYVLYKHITPSHKVYIGITRQSNINKRWQYGYGYIVNPYFYRAIKKYGWENIKHEIVLKDLTYDEACEMEIKLISIYESDKRQYGYNRSPGGDLISDESIAKMKRTRALNGYSKKLSTISKSRWSDPRMREKIIASMQNKTRTEEQKQHYKAASAYRIGKPLSEEIKAKISHTLSQKTGENSIRKKTVYQIDTQTGDIVHVHLTARLAAEFVGVSINRISCVCRSKNKCCKGFFWCYTDEYSPELFKDMLGITLNENGKIARIGERSSFYGKKHSKEAIDKIKACNGKRVQCIETGEIYNSLEEAGKAFGIGGENISRQINGKVKTAAKHTWRFV